MKKQILPIVLTSLISAFYLHSAAAQEVNRIRLGAKFLLPNIAGVHGEFVLPIAGDRLSLTADYSYLPLTALVEQVVDFEGEIDASVKYLSLGTNFYLNNKGRARGAYFGLSYLNLGAQTKATDADFSSKGKVDINALMFRFGTNAGRGRFLFGFELGAGLPLGNLSGTIVTQENGNYEQEYYDEKIPVVPALNFTLGYAFGGGSK
jgi:hypothetical protein